MFHVKHFYDSDVISICWQDRGMSGTPRVKPRRPRKLFLQGRREAANLTQEEAGAKLRPPVAGMTVSRWETGTSRPNDNVLAALGEVYGCEPEDFYYDPQLDPTPNQLLRGQDPGVIDAAMKMLRGLRQG